MDKPYINPASPHGALSDLQVLDLTRVLAGPWATQTLADMGARVIKVERPDGGDDTRVWGPPFVGPDPLDDQHDAAYYSTANRNKQSLAIDIASEQGAALVRELAQRSDILVENFKVGGLAKYGLDYASLAAINPRLIYCSITGFGQTGPYAQRPGYDFIIQAMSGLMSVTGQAPGSAGDEPMKIGVALSDVLTGLYSTIGILTALAHRNKTGKGQHIDMSLLDVSVAAMANQAMSYLVTGTAPQRLGNAHPTIVPYQVFPTRDGHIIIAVGNQRQFVNMARVLGDPAMAEDPRYQSNTSRLDYRNELVGAISALSRARTTAQWIELFGEAQVPCGPINDLEAVFNDPQVLARELAISPPHALHGSVPGVACPLRLSDTPPVYHSAPPLLGQHTRTILTDDLAISAVEYQQMLDNGICAEHHLDTPA